MIDNEKARGNRVLNLLWKNWHPSREGFIQPVNKGFVIFQSGLENEQLKTLKSSNRKSILSVDEFWGTARRRSLISKHGYSLGLTNCMDLYESASLALDYAAWRPAYEAMGLLSNNSRRLGRFASEVDSLPPNHTHIFLNRITDSGLSTVFFVPPDVLSHFDGKTVTGKEMQWCLTHPEKITDFYFVFGLYDVISKNRYRELTKIYLEERVRIAEMVKSFKRLLKS